MLLYNPEVNLLGNNLKIKPNLQLQASGFLFCFAKLM